PQGHVLDPQKTQTAHAGLFALRRPFPSSSLIVLRDGGGSMRGKIIFARAKVVNIRTRAGRNHRDVDGLGASWCVYGTILPGVFSSIGLRSWRDPCTQANVGQISR